MIHTAAGHHQPDRLPALVGDLRIPGVQRDAQLEDIPRMSRWAAVSEVHPQQVHIGGGKVAKLVEVAAGLTAVVGPETAALGNAPVHPVANRRPRHAEKPGDLCCGVAFGGELEASSDDGDGMRHANTCSHGPRTAYACG